MASLPQLLPVGVTPDGKLIPNEPLAQFELGTMRNFVYLILDATTKRAVIVDPQKDIETPLRALLEAGFALEAIWLTHSHHDHIAGVPALLEKFPQLPVFVHAEDRFRLTRLPPTTKIHGVDDGDILGIGNLRVEALHLPGHSVGALGFFIRSEPPRFLSGDTLFIRDCGRTDLETGSNDAMFASLQRIKKLPPETVLLPGHHYAPECASTLREEFETSPPLRCGSVDELRQLP